jgi:hypothetical protein
VGICDVKIVYEITKHAKKVMEERGILDDWVARTFSSPELTRPDPKDAQVEQRFRRIPEFGGRILRVVVNKAVEPKRILSVFFDRAMKGKL